MNAYGILFLGIASIMVLLGAMLANADDFLDRRQMINTKGFPVGLPWIWHLGMWGDMFIINPLDTYILNQYHSYWGPGWCVLFGVASLVVAFIACAAYDGGPIPESHTYEGRRSPTGWVHMYYMALAVFPILMFYTITPPAVIAPKVAMTVGMLLTFHIFIGTHSLLKLFAPERFGFQGYGKKDAKETIYAFCALAGLTALVVCRR